MVNIRLSKNGVVLKLGSSNSWAVVGDQDEFGLSSSQGLDGVLVTCVQMVVNI
tara:strand:+ start:277 stop:435 length:159 start_codon:yes stop_codon:yes gene_type:complete